MGFLRFGEGSGVSDDPQFSGFKHLEANYTRTPNQFFDKIVGRYEYCVVAVVAILIRSTEGWREDGTGERKVEAELPMTRFVRSNLSITSVRKGLRAAIAAGFIVETQPYTKHSAARYALRWEDEKALDLAVRKQRAADAVTAENRPSEIRGQESEGQKSRGPVSGGQASGGQISEGLLKETGPEKKKKEKRNLIPEKRRTPAIQLRCLQKRKQDSPPPVSSAGGQTRRPT